MDRDELTKQMKELAKRSGAALVGVASIDRFDPMPPYYDRVPRGQHPCDFLPEAKSVISIAMPILNPTMDAPARLNEMDLEMYPKEAVSHWLDSFYNKVAHANHDVFLLMIGQIIGQFLLENGYEAMLFPTEGVHFTTESGKKDSDIMMGESDKWARENSPFRYLSGPISHRHCATRAGLGEFGYHNLVLTPQFGSRQRFNTIVTDADLVADPLITTPICLRDNCKLCLKACHANALFLRDDPGFVDYRQLDKVDKDVIFIDTPSKTSTIACRDRKQGLDVYPIRGDCVRICPVPNVRKHLPKHLQDIIDDWHGEN